MRKKGIAWLLFSWMFLSVVSGQEKLSFTLAAAKDYALNYNKMLKTAGFNVDKAHEKLAESIANGLPQVDATVDYSNFFGASMEIRFSENAPASMIPFKPTSNFNLRVGQLIFSGNYIVGIKIAKLAEEMAARNVEKSELDIIQQVTQSYYLVLISEDLQDIVEKNLENVRDLYNKTKLMVSTGVAEQTDLDQISIQVAFLENTLKSGERQIEMAYNMLRLNLGIPADTEITLTEKMPGILAGINFEDALTDPFELSKNIDYQLVKKQEEMSARQVELEKMGYLPTVSGFYNYTYKILKPNFDISPKNVIGLNVSIPIFSSGVRKHKVSEARIGLESARINKEYLSDQLSIQEKQLRFNLRNALDKYQSQKENVEVSERVYENMNMKYQQGLVSSIDLTTSNSNYLQAETQYVNALLQLLQAHTELEKLMNEL